MLPVIVSVDWTARAAEDHLRISLYARQIKSRETNGEEERLNNENTDVRYLLFVWYTW